MISSSRSRGVESGTLQRRGDHLRQIAVLELARRQIHGHAEAAIAIALPLSRLPAGFAQHPLADRHDQPRLLGDRDEVLRPDQTEAGAVPAQQRFDAGHASRGDVDLRLVVELQLAALERVAQIVLQRQPLQRAAVHRRREHLIRVAARVLGAIHRVVGVRQQRLGRVAVARKKRDADAGGDEQLRPFDLQRQRDRVEHLLRDLRRGVGRLQIGQQDGELVAAHARDRVLLAQRRLQPRGDRFQQLVAGRMAERVVDDLEAIEIEKHHRQRMLHAPRVRERDRQAIAEQPAVRQAGQRIVIGLILDLLLDPLALGDVARDADDLADLCR